MHGGRGKAGAKGHSLKAHACCCQTATSADQRAKPKPTVPNPAHLPDPARELERRGARGVQRAPALVKAQQQRQQARPGHRSRHQRCGLLGRGQHLRLVQQQEKRLVSVVEQRHQVCGGQRGVGCGGAHEVRPVRQQAQQLPGGRVLVLLQRSGVRPSQRAVERQPSAV